MDVSGLLKLSIRPLEKWKGKGKIRCQGLHSARGTRLYRYFFPSGKDSHCETHYCSCCFTWLAHLPDGCAQCILARRPYRRSIHNCPFWLFYPSCKARGDVCMQTSQIIVWDYTSLQAMESETNTASSTTGIHSKSL